MVRERTPFRGLRVGDRAPLATSARADILERHQDGFTGPRGTGCLPAPTSSMRTLSRAHARMQGETEEMSRLVGLRHRPSWASRARRAGATTTLQGPSLRARDVVQTCAVAPLDLRVLPDATRSCDLFSRPIDSALAGGRRPNWRRSFLSWDCPKITPPPFRHREVHSRARARSKPRSLPSGRACQRSSSFRPRAFPAPRRLAPSWRCARVAARCRPWGSPRFRDGAPDRALTRAEHLRASPRCVPALRSHPRAQRRATLSGDPRGRVTDGAVTRDDVHHVPCPFVVSVAARSGGSHPRRPARSRAPAFTAPAPAPSRRGATPTG